MYQITHGRIDAAISDKNIFLDQLSKFVGKNKENHFSFKSILPLTPRGIKFHNKKLRDQFNKGLKIIKKNGTHSKILKKYAQYLSPSMLMFLIKRREARS